MFRDPWFVFRSRRAGLLCLALFLSLALVAAPCFADFRFVVIGDSQGYAGGVNKKVLSALMERARAEHPEFIIFTGDIVTGSEKKSVHRKMLTVWKNLVYGYGIPVYIAPGNHDILSDFSEGLFRSEFEMPENGPGELKELVYSFDYHNAHFIAIDTEIYASRHRLGDVQSGWLKEDLKNNKNELVFIFGHEPAYPVAYHKGSSLDVYLSDRDNLWQVFIEYGVDIYFCGHEHLYNSSLHDGVYQIITGGGGGLPRVLTRQGGFYHYVMVDVKDSGECEITVKDMHGNIKDSFSLNTLP